MTATVRVGVLNDMADLGEVGDVTEWLEREVEALQTSGRIEAQVEFVHAYGLGLPSGTAEAIEQAYQDLAKQDVLLIVGPAMGDNAMIATPLAERMRVPTINWSGAERARGKYMFQLQVGSHEDEALVIARHLAASGAKRLGVVYDVSPLGTRHLKYLEDEAAVLGLELVAREGISPVATEAREQVEAVLSAEPDSFVYLGLGVPATAVADEVAAADWSGTRIMNTAGHGVSAAEFGRRCEGWAYIDMHSDSNRTLQTLCKERKLTADDTLAAARGHDLGRLVAEGLSRAHGLTREGVRNGLEQVKWLPAAEGEEGTLLGFGVQDRGALHGRFLVVRQWIDGKSVEVQRH
jgi:ABC-type branched-subunit amino acid transport system substrate-binding protein